MHLGTYLSPTLDLRGGRIPLLLHFVSTRFRRVVGRRLNGYCPEIGAAGSSCR